MNYYEWYGEKYTGGYMLIDGEIVYIEDVVYYESCYCIDDVYFVLGNGKEVPVTDASIDYHCKINYGYYKNKDTVFHISPIYLRSWCYSFKLYMFNINILKGDNLSFKEVLRSCLLDNNRLVTDEILILNNVIYLGNNKIGYMDKNISLNKKYMYLEGIIKEIYNECRY